jgi:hypothetical protein
MKIQVTIENVYGTRRVYPACANAKAFADIAGTSTLTPAVINKIKALGFTIEVIQPTHTL